MTKFKTLLLVVVAAVAITSCDMMGPSTDQAVEYNDNIIKKQIKIIESIDELDGTFTDFVPDEMDAALEAAIEETEDGIELLKGLEDFDGSPEFKDNALILFNVYLDALENEFTEMVEIYKLPSDEYTEELQDKWGDLYDDGYDNMSDGLEDFNDYQSTFAVKYGFMIVDDKF